MTKKKQKDDVKFFVIEDGFSQIAEFGSLVEVNLYLESTCKKKGCDRDSSFRVIKGEELSYTVESIAYPIFEE